MKSKPKTNKSKLFLRLYNENPYQENYGRIAKLHKELGVSSPFNRRTECLSLPKIIQTSKKRDSEPIRKDRRSSIQEFIDNKRKILLSKLKIMNKEEHIKAMKEYLLYEEKQLHMRIEDLKENTNLIKQNFEDQKKKMEALVAEVNDKEEIKNERTRILQETKNKIYQRESEVKALGEKLAEFDSLKIFMNKLYGHFGQVFEEKRLLKYIALKFGREDFCQDSSAKEQEALRQNQMTAGKPPESFFITSKNEVHAPSPQIFGELEKEFMVKFSEKLALIEANNFQLHEELQSEELKLRELAEDLARWDEKAGDGTEDAA